MLRYSSFPPPELHDILPLPNTMIYNIYTSTVKECTDLYVEA